MVFAGSAGLGMIAAGRPTGVRKSFDGKRLMVNAMASWKWFATGAQFGAVQPRVIVEGTVRVPGRYTGVGPRGLEDRLADATSPAPGLPEYALVGRIGEWTGLLTGEGDVLAAMPRTGELWLAVNVAAERARKTEGAFRITILL